MKIEKSYWNLIVKFYTDELSNEESAILDNWKSKSEDNLKFLEQFNNVLNATDDSFVNIETNDDKLWNRLQDRIKESIESRKVINIRSYFIKISIAASVILCLAFGVDFFFNNNSVELEFITIQTNSKSQNIHLPDSSWVYLAANSLLKYNSDFKNNRKSDLEGEAYFIVTKDKLHPFIVFTKSTITKVVGTEFNIKTEEENVEIEVTKGVVEFGSISSKEHSKLIKGDNAHYNSKSKKIVKNKSEKKQLNLWKKIKKEVKKIFKKNKN